MQEINLKKNFFLNNYSDDNELTGALPSEIGQLDSVESIQLGKCHGNTFN